MRPIAGTDRCEYHHLGYCVSGRLHVTLRDGSEAEIGPAEVFEIPAGHDARVIGDEPWIAIDFRGARSYARPMAASTDRILATVLFTDIVDFDQPAAPDGRHCLARPAGRARELVHSSWTDTAAA